MVTTIDALLDHHAIRDVLYRYCRAIDRRQYDDVRACYHPDATDDHGVYQGGVDGFIDYISRDLPRYERTMHFLGNVLVELDGDSARAETYCIAYHRVPVRGDKPERDFTVGLRYVDRFARRDGRWAIAERVCAFEWSRLDPVPAGGFPPSFLRGVPGSEDIVVR